MQSSYAAQDQMLAHANTHECSIAVQRFFNAREVHIATNNATIFPIVVTACLLALTLLVGSCVAEEWFLKRQDWHRFRV